MGAISLPLSRSVLKEQGNAAFSRGEYEEAVGLFTRAIQVDPSWSVLFSNRSAAHAALKNFQQALHDGRKALQLQPRWSKAYSRIAVAHYGMKQYVEAAAAYEKGLKCDPHSTVCKQGLQQARERLQQEDEKEAKTWCPVLAVGSHGDGGFSFMLFSIPIVRCVGTGGEAQHQGAYPTFTAHGGGGCAGPRLGGIWRRAGQRGDGRYRTGDAACGDRCVRRAGDASSMSGCKGAGSGLGFRVHTAMAIPPHDRLLGRGPGHMVKAAPGEGKFSYVSIAGGEGEWYARCIMLFHFIDGEAQIHRRAVVWYFDEHPTPCPVTGCARLLPTVGEDEYAVVEVDNILSLAHIVPCFTEPRFSLVNRFLFDD
ncbi:unnamed protein product [Closterium sp. Yama58-4]|nr:unnamed protein product [Closterium sp. Yama58-4]